MATKLKSCPFCGSAKIQIEELPDAGDDNPLVHAKCANCKAEGPLRATWVEARDAWNTRPEPKTKGDGNR